MDDFTLVSDEITVGYEFTVYPASEEQEEVVVCAVIYEPELGGAPRDFVLLSTTRDGSASMWLAPKLHSNYNSYYRGWT